MALSGTTPNLIQVRDVTDDFKAFPKIPRLRRGCVITEKIDGTNAQVVVPADPTQPLRFGSRNRWITPENDNYGFARWATEHEDELRKLGHGRHYGEWWGQGIQRCYGMEGVTGGRFFHLFNTGRWNAPESALPNCVGIVPILYSGPFTDSAVDECLELLKTRGSIVAPGFMKPEGVVVFHQASGSLMKVLIENDSQPKGAAES